MNDLRNGTARATAQDVTLTNTAIEQFILDELSAIQYEERRLRSAFASAARDNAAAAKQYIALAVAKLDRRAAELDRMLDEMAVSHARQDATLLAA